MFNVGDKIICVGAGNTYLTLDKVYTVSGHDISGMFVRVNEIGGGWLASRFKKVNPVSVNDIDISTMTGPELKLLIRRIKKVLASTPITMYSTTGNKWGKRKYPDSELMMTYNIIDGMPTNIEVSEV